MPPSDAVLFDKWRASRDADAFAELLSRHATMVYGACLRVLKNPGMAEEVAQESFLELMKGPRGVRCVGAWLHTVATRRALDRLKAEGRRAEREQRYASALGTAAETDWDDTRAFVDEAIAALSEELRVPIVLRFLEGRTHEAIAEELALSRSTVRSRIEKGIGAVREHLVKRGVIVSAGAIAAGLESLPASAAPPALLADLGKRALAMRSGSNVLSVAAGAKYVLAPVVLAALVLGGVWATARRGDAPEGTPAVADGGGAVVAALVAPEPTPPPEVPSVESGTVESAEAEVSDAPETVPAEVEEENTAEGWVLDLTPSEDVLQALQKPVQIEFRDTHIKDILEFMQDTYDVNLVLDGRVVAPKPDGDGAVPASRRYVTDGHIRHINLRDKTLEEALAVMTTMLNLTYKARGNFIWVSSSSRITEDLTVPLPSASFREGKMIKKVSGKINVEFEDIHIADLLDFLGGSFKVPIVIDSRVVMPEAERGKEPDILPTYTTDGMIDYLNLKATPMGEALFAITRLLDLTYRVGKDAVYISTPDRVRESF